MAAKRTIVRSTFDDDARRWTLGGMAENMFAWLETLAAGSDRYRGFQLTGTLDPRDPDPTKFKAPPKWLKPDVLMDAVCAWQAGAAQDYLFTSGMAPLVRVRITADGEIDLVSGADVELATGAVEDTGSYKYYVVVNQEDSPYPLGDLSTVSITPATSFSKLTGGANAQPVIAARLDSAVVPNEQLSALVDPAEIPFARFSGWAYWFEGAQSAADVHIFV